jgi:hypothetical protein
MRTKTLSALCKFLLIAFILYAKALHAYSGLNTIDPVQFTISTQATYLNINEEFEIKITARYLSLNPNLVYVFEGSNSFKLKLITPEGFKQTGGTYRDFIGTELTSSKPSITYTIKGKFTSEVGFGTFQLLRSHKNADDQSQYVQVGKLAFATMQLGDLAEEKANRLAVVPLAGYIPYLSIAKLRMGSADSAAAVYIIDAGKYGLFRLDTADTSTPDDNAMVLVYATKRFKRVCDYVTPEMFGAKADGVSDDRLAIQAMLDLPNAKYQFKKNAVYRTSGQLLIKHSNSELVGNNATIKPTTNFSPLSGSLMQTANSAAMYSNIGVSILISKGDASISFTNASTQLRVGDMVRLEGPNSYVNGNQTYAFGHLSQIKAITGDIVLLTEPAIESFTATKIYTYSRLNALKISKLNFDLDQTNVFNALTLHYCTNSTISGGSYHGRTIGEIGISVDECINMVVEDLEVSSFSKLVGDNPIAYGISVHGHNITVRKSRVEDCKHTLTTSDRRYMSTGINFENNICYGLPQDNNTAPLDFHGNARGTCRGNTIYSFAPVGMQFRDGGIDVLDNTLNLNWKGPSTTLKGIFFGEKYFGENRIEGNVINIYHANAPLATQAINVDLISGIRNRNVTIRKNIINEGFINWEQSDGGLLITENRLDAPAESGNAMTFAGVLLTDVIDFEVSGNQFFNRNVSFTGASVLNVAASSSRGLIYNNTIYVIEGAALPLVKLFGPQIRMIDNLFVSNSSYGNYIGFYTVSSKALLQGNKRVDSSGDYSPITYQNNLPTASAFYLDKIININTAVGTTAYSCKLIASNYVWVLSENLTLTNTATTSPTKAMLNSTYGYYKAGTTVFYSELASGPKRYVKLTDSNSGDWDAVSPTLVP